MAVKDFMTKKVVYISPETKVSQAAELMREQGLRRLPVIEHDKLVGLVTEGTLADARPSKATSLSIYEMNYLLNKTKVKDVMIKDVVTVEPYASLEDAVYLMMKHKVGVLPVTDGQYVSGIITDKDVFRTFLEASGYGEEGVRVRVLTDNRVGALAQIVKVIADENINIRRTIEVSRPSGQVVIEIQLEGNGDIISLEEKLSQLDITIDGIEKTQAKAIF